MRWVIIRLIDRKYPITFLLEKRAYGSTNETAPACDQH
jgi:hypothetical protein